MNEQEWLAAADYHSMLTFLRSWASDRKLRLYSCECCRAIDKFHSDQRLESAVKIAERHIEGKVTVFELLAANRDLGGSIPCPVSVPIPGDAFWSDLACMVTHDDAFDSAYVVSEIVAFGSKGGWRKDNPLICLKLRDIFGNPFRPVTLDPVWLQWHDAAIPRLAQHIYDGRCFADLPILADALEEAGCTTADILDHCRGPGPHVRGCWVVDLILGKN